MTDGNNRAESKNKPDGGISPADKYGVNLSKSYVDACSANDCTGLIPSLPKSMAEIESYEALYHFLPEANLPKET